jgi:hypothetical protein
LLPKVPLHTVFITSKAKEEAAAEAILAEARAIKAKMKSHQEQKREKKEPAEEELLVQHVNVKYD